jgi:hypothetical protein
MDLRVRRVAMWWGTLAAGLVLVAVGMFGYLIVSEELRWYETEVSEAKSALAGEMGDYVRIEGRIALNATKDVVVVEKEVTKAVWTVEEYEYTVSHVWVEGDDGGVVTVLFDHISVTKPGRHGGDYHKGDWVCIGGTIAIESTGRKALRANFVAKHPEDTPARFADLYLIAAISGMFLILMFVITRYFLSPRLQKGPDWRGT